MRISEPEQSKLAESIKMDRLPALSSTGVVSGYEQFGGWLNVGGWFIPKERMTLLGSSSGDIKIWLDCGLTLSLTLRSNVDFREAQRSILSEQDISKLVQSISVGRA